MYTLYAHETANPIKVEILLQELGVEHTVQRVNFATKEQLSPEFLEINPNGKIPVLVDHDQDDFRIVESGAILQYLAEKHGAFLPKDPKEKSEVIQWLTWQLAGLGPMFGQYFVFNGAFQNAYPPATQRYEIEARRLFKLLDEHLATRDYVAAGQHTIADMAIWPWVRMTQMAEWNLGAYPNVKEWFDRLGETDAYKKALVAVGTTPPDEKVAGFLKAVIGLDTDEKAS